jgi:hypothetical protein
LGYFANGDAHRLSKQKAVPAFAGTAFRILVPGAGIEPARLAAGDFESAIYSVSTGKWGEF